VSALPQVPIEIPDKLQFLVGTRKRYKVVFGGRGSLKSWTIARVLLGLGRSRKMLILCAREFQKSIKDSVHRLLRNQIALLGIGEDKGEYKVTDTKIVHLQTGTEFIFVGLHFNTVDLKSLEGVDICWVEEAEAISADSWTILDPTIRKEGSEIWVSFNPGEETDPTWQRFVADPMPADVATVVSVSWKDNYWLPSELERQAKWMREHDPESYLHIWEGKTWFRNEAQVLNRVWGIKDFDPAAIPHRSGPYFGADWGFSTSPTALVKSYVETLNPEDFGKTYVTNEGDEVNVFIHRNLYIAEEAFAMGCEFIARDGQPGLTELFEQVSESRKYLIRADCARPETISHMSKEGFMIEPCEKWPKCAEDGVAYLRGFDHIYVHPSCVNMIQQSRLWSFKTNPLDRKQVLPRLKDGNDDGWDATRYAHESLITRTPTMFDVL
jgi:phage terminase large subunit